MVEVGDLFLIQCIYNKILSYKKDFIITRMGKGKSFIFGRKCRISSLIRVTVSGYMCSNENV